MLDKHPEQAKNDILNQENLISILLVVILVEQVRLIYLNSYNLFVQNLLEFFVERTHH